MTFAEIRALDLIRDRIVRTQAAPTLDELAAALGWKSKSTAHFVVTSLVEQGVLVRQRGAHRGLALADAPKLMLVPTPDLQAELTRCEQGAGQ